jgi:Uncharacterised nucleotidyltransferase
VKNALAEAIVDFLSFSNHDSDRVRALSGFSSRRWEKSLQWLDDAGLSFYFLHRLKKLHADTIVPAWALFRLERDFAANQKRVDYMWQRFDLLNRTFHAAGVRFVALKGLTLVPEFCPNGSLRYQADFDYLVDEQSLPVAKLVLCKAGYRPKDTHSNLESLFVIPHAPAPSRGGDQYDARAGHAVELHLSVWHSDLHKLPAIPNLFSVEQGRTQQRNGCSFIALADHDAFLLQIVHACSHLFTHWIRISSLFEIGYFLDQRAGDVDLWNRVARRVGDNAALREFAAVVTGLVATLFSPSIPPLLDTWGTQLRPAPRTWMEKYARDWALSELPVHQFSPLPKTKLDLFLRQQYEDENGHLQSMMRLPPVSSSRVSGIISSVKADPSLFLQVGWWRRQLLVRRSLYHALADLRYLFEIPRWLWLTRVRSGDRRLNLE